MTFIQIVQNILLSEWLIFGVVMLAAVLISRWALLALREYAGFVLGCLVALFVVFVVSALIGQPDAITAQVADSGAITLNWGQIIVATLMGLGTGAGTLVFGRVGQNANVQQAITVAVVTALPLILLFILFISDSVTRRMIGIFSLAYGIGALFTWVIGRGKLQGPPDDPPDNPTSTGTMSRLDAIRQRHQPPRR